MKHQDRESKTLPFKIPAITHGRGIHANKTTGGGMRKLKSPYPWFGGKGEVASLVWSRLGSVSNYIEPFFGSGAMLLLRPDPSGHETINDLDCYVANLWRATQSDSEAVVRFADGPINEVDLHARHRYLLLSDDAAEFRKRMRSDPDYYDARIAGWWCWGLGCWIGSNWCSEANVEKENGQRINGKSADTNNNLPAQTPRDLGVGVCAGMGTSGPLPRLDENGGQHGICEARRQWLLDWFGRLRDRLRFVRVCCGDWSRVCSSETVTTGLGITGVFLDPPYALTTSNGQQNRAKKIYSLDGSDGLVGDVQAWCRAYGGNPRMRIAVCGYSGEGYESLEQSGWQVVHWKTKGGYANQARAGNTNSSRERIWFSPHCLNSRGLFDHTEGSP